MATDTRDTTIAKKEGGGLVVKADPKAAGYKQLLSAEGFKAALSNVLPRHIKADKFVRVTLSAMSNQPKLYKCAPETVMLSMLRAAAYGLEPDGGVLGHGYLVPFWNSKNSRHECQFIPGFRGLIKLAINSGEIADIQAEVVYEKDKFSYTLGLEPTLSHVRDDASADPGPLKYVYAVARFRSGDKKFIVMNKREVEKIKSSSASRGKDGKLVGPWVDHEPEMWKKTGVRRICKMLPLSQTVHKMIDDDDPEAAGLNADVFAAVPDIEIPEALALPSPEDDGDTIDESRDSDTGKPTDAAVDKARSEVNAKLDPEKEKAKEEIRKAVEDTAPKSAATPGKPDFPAQIGPCAGIDDEFEGCKNAIEIGNIERNSRSAYGLDKEQSAWLRAAAEYYRGLLKAAKK